MAQAGRKRIVILGGGIAGLVTAFELTSPPDWRERIESVTLHQMGWRLGGKCASSRGPDGRIQEHGIHGFLGSYFNALPLFAACYDELARPPEAPLATFEAALRPENYGVLWEWREGRMRSWAQRFPTNTRSPRDRGPFPSALQRSLSGLFEALGDQVLQLATSPGSLAANLKAQVRRLVERLADCLGHDLALGPRHPLLAAIREGWDTVGRVLYPLIGGDDDLRRLFLVLDHQLTLVAGALADDVGSLGYDRLDEENYADWLARHGARPETIASPLPLNFINMTYQYPEGDTSRPPVMAAGAYVHWALQAGGYIGSFIWRFAAGTGETLIAPLYEVLRRRGVRFEFFHKVERLRLSPDGRRIAAVDIKVQATLAEGRAEYEPLIEVKGLPGWPGQPLFGQLAQGEALRASQADLESYWTAWPGAGSLQLEDGRDFDQVVFAISIGAVPHLCQELLDQDPKWRDTVGAVPAHLTQAMQIWVDRDLAGMGWSERLQPGETVLSTTYLNPINGNAEFGDLIAYEDWPPAMTPRGLWYFCGLMTSDEPEPPFDDHDYPRRQDRRVRSQCIQYLQAGIAPLAPLATTNAGGKPGDPFGFDFDRLVDTREAAGAGIARFDAQFWRANIDPTERYVASPPGSTRARLKAWDSGFENLVLAGDWIHTGVNVGSVEGTVMSGRLASFALTGRPALAEIPSYPTPERPAG
jgi:uncharacterized protein with NAD-binding domain and iron-sulfur cluster